MGGGQIEVAFHFSDTSVLFHEQEETLKYKDINAETIERWIADGWEWAEITDQKAHPHAQSGTHSRTYRHTLSEIEARYHALEEQLALAIIAQLSHENESLASLPW